MIEPKLNNPWGRDISREMTERRMKQRIVLAELRDFLKDYDPDLYEDGSGDVTEIFDVVKKMIRDADPPESLKERFFFFFFSATREVIDIYDIRRRM